MAKIEINDLKSNAANEIAPKDIERITGGWSISGDADDRPTEEVSFFKKSKTSQAVDGADFLAWQRNTVK